MKLRHALLLSFLTLALPLIPPAPAQDSRSTQSSGDQKLEYKVVSGYKDAFNDNLKYQLSKGWRPFGGVSVTTFNGDLFFAQLLCRNTDR